MTALTIPANDVVAGTRLLYPCQERTGTTDQPRTVRAVVEYPANRVLYFAEGGYGIVDRRVDLKLDEVDEVAVEVAAGRACGLHDRPLPCLECEGA